MDNRPNVQVQEIDSEELKKIGDFFVERYRCTLKRYGQKGYLLPKGSSVHLNKIRNMQLRSSDIFVTSFPKSGTTWTQELVWLIANDLNFEKAQSIRLTHRFAFLENQLLMSVNIDKTEPIDENFLKTLEIICPPLLKDFDVLPSPRFLKTHLAMSLLPHRMLDTCKVIYIARDPRDVAVSFYFHAKFLMMAGENKTLKDVWNLLLKNQVLWSPIFEHIKEAWQCRDHPNMLFLFYEELSKDLSAVVKKVANFLGKELTSEEVKKLCEYLKFSNFKKNPAVNYEEAKEFGYVDVNGSFIRKGAVGDWIEYFDKEMKEEAERWFSENMSDSDLSFPK